MMRIWMSTIDTIDVPINYVNRITDDYIELINTDRVYYKVCNVIQGDTLRIKVAWV